VAEYVERWRGDIFEVMAYAGRVATQDKTHYSRCLIIPLPPNFEFPDNIKSFPNSIIILEDKERVKRKGIKRTRPLGPFLGGRLGRTLAIVAIHTGESKPRNRVWIDKGTFMRITKRNLYVDKFYATKIFNKE
jgi:hypothetical protein